MSISFSEGDLHAFASKIALDLAEQEQLAVPCCEVHGQPTQIIYESLREILPTESVEGRQLLDHSSPSVTDRYLQGGGS